jgi:hypothetical protein
MEIRFFINDALIQEIQERTQLDRATDVGREAINVLNWATKQAYQGRQLWAGDMSGNAIAGAYFPSVEAAWAKGIQDKRQK